MSQEGILDVIDSHPQIATTYVAEVGSAVPALNELNIVGTGGVTTSASGNTVTIQGTEGVSRFPITPFVVGPVGFAGYQTIQSALDAANTAGGGTVIVQPGVYVENLTLYDNTQVVGNGFGDSGDPTITGVHTPPLTGNFAFKSVFLTSATDIFNSSAAGSSSLFIIDCLLLQANGYTWNLPNWTSDANFVFFDIGDLSTINGVINNTGGATVLFDVATCGAGSAKTMVISGSYTNFSAEVRCPVNFRTGSVIQVDSAIFHNTVTFSNNSTGIFSDVRFASGSNVAITMSSSAPIAISNSIVNSSNNPAISGAGAGTLTLNNISFQSNAIVAGTLTLSSTGGLYPPGSLGSVGYVWTSHGEGVVPSFQAVTASGAVTSFSTDSGSAAPSSGVITFNALSQAGASVTFSGSGSTVKLNVTDSLNNTIIGKSSGNGSITAQGCVCLGNGNFVNLTSGNSNTAIGANATLALVTSGQENTACGSGALSQVLTGSHNMALGVTAGSSYTSSESSNIVIGNIGTILDANTIRVGTQGSGASQQNKCFIAGISGVTVSNTQLVTIDSTTGQLGANNPAPSSINIQTFTGNGTYTPTSGMIYCTIELVGGGGGGGGVSDATALAGNAAGGGGSGSYSRSVFAASTIGASQTVTIGAGGTAGANTGGSGGSGGATSVAALITAVGGAGGVGSTGAGDIGGVGGIAGTGQVALIGNAGGSGNISLNGGVSSVSGGFGANSFFGAGGLSTSASSSLPGNAGVKGGGGSGACCYNASGAQAGAAGGAGYVVVTEYIM